jgi:hypothetical protein
MCSSINKRLIAALEGKKAIRTVVLVCRWSRYFEGMRLRDMQVPKQLLMKSSHDDVVALNSAIRNLEEGGRSVVLIGPEPESVVDGARLHYLRS